MPFSPLHFAGETPGGASECSSLSTASFLVRPPLDPPCPFWQSLVTASANALQRPPPKSSPRAAQSSPSSNGGASRVKASRAVPSPSALSRVLVEAFNAGESESEAGGLAGECGGEDVKDGGLPQRASSALPELFRLCVDSVDERPSPEELPSLLLRCHRADSQHKVLLRAAAAAVSAAMEKPLSTVCRLVLTHSKVTAREARRLAPPPSSAFAASPFATTQNSVSALSIPHSRLQTPLPFVVLLAGADAADHRLASRLLLFKLSRLAPCCCSARRVRASAAAQTPRPPTSAASLFLRLAVLKPSDAPNLQTAMRSLHAQLKASRCCADCRGETAHIGSRSAGPAASGVVGGVVVGGGGEDSDRAETGAEEGDFLVEDAAAEAAWSVSLAATARAAESLRPEEALLLQCLDRGTTAASERTSSVLAGGDGPGVEDEASAQTQGGGGAFAVEALQRLALSWQRQRRLHAKGFCFRSRALGAEGRARTRAQLLREKEREKDRGGENDISAPEGEQQEADAGLPGKTADSDGDGSADEAVSDGEDEKTREGRDGSSCWTAGADAEAAGEPGAFVVLLEEVEAFPSKALSDLLLLLSLLRSEHRVPVSVLGLAAASPAFLLQLPPCVLRKVHADAALALRPRAVHSALLQLLLCCTAASPFALPAVAVEELQGLLQSQDASVPQLLGVLKLLVLKFFGEHPLSFLSLEPRELFALLPSDLQQQQSPPAGQEPKDKVLSTSAKALKTLERRVALLSAAVLSEDLTVFVQRQLRPFNALRAALEDSAASLVSPCCAARLREEKAFPQKTEDAAGIKPVCSRSPTCAVVGSALQTLRIWWQVPEASDPKKLVNALLPRAALELAERRVAYSVAFRQLLVLERHIQLQRRGAREAASGAALGSLSGGSASEAAGSGVALGLLLEVLGGGRGLGYHDLLLQKCNEAHSAKVVLLIGKELTRAATACCRTDSLCSALLAAVLPTGSAWTQRRLLADALGKVIEDFLHQTRRERRILEALENHLDARRRRLSELFAEHESLLDVVRKTRSQPLQERRPPPAEQSQSQGVSTAQAHQQQLQSLWAGAASVVRRRASVQSGAVGNANLGDSQGALADPEVYELFRRFQKLMRRTLQHLLLPLPQWHPLGCEVCVWSLSAAAVERPLRFAVSLAAPLAPEHKSEAAAVDAFARVLPLRPAEVLVQLAGEDLRLLELHRCLALRDEDAAAEAPAAGESLVDDVGLVYRRLSFGSRRLPLWGLFCAFCADLLEENLQRAALQQRLADAGEKGGGGRREANSTKSTAASPQTQPALARPSLFKARGEKRARRGVASQGGDPRAGDALTPPVDKADKDGSEESRAAAQKAVLLARLEDRVVEELYEEGTKSVAPHKAPSLVRLLFLRFVLALSSLAQMGLARVPNSAAAFEESLLPNDEDEAAAERCTPQQAVDAAEAEEALLRASSGDTSGDSQDEGGAPRLPKKGKSKVAEFSECASAPTTAPPRSTAREVEILRQQMRGQWVTRCFFGSVFQPRQQAPVEADSASNASSKSAPACAIKGP